MHSSRPRKSCRKSAVSCRRGLFSFRLGCTSRPSVGCGAADARRSRRTGSARRTICSTRAGATPKPSLQRVLDRLHALVEHLEIDARHLRAEADRAADQSRDRREIARALGHGIGDEPAEADIVAADRHQHHVDRPLARRRRAPVLVDLLRADRGAADGRTSAAYSSPAACGRQRRRGRCRSVSWSSCARTLPPPGSLKPSRGSISRTGRAATSAPEQVKLAKRDGRDGGSPARARCRRGTDSRIANDGNRGSATARRPCRKRPGIPAEPSLLKRSAISSSISRRGSTFGLI